MHNFNWSAHTTHIGTVFIASTDKGVCKITIPGQSKREFMNWLEKHAGLGSITEDPKRHRRIAEELNRYFSRGLVRFHARLDPIGTAFQKQVWRELRKVRYGTTITYKELSKRIGKPGGYQTVGRANGANPLPIIIPCHRVIGSEGRLVGYAAGVKTKEFLLRLEGALLL